MRSRATYVVLIAAIVAGTATAGDIAPDHYVFRAKPALFASDPMPFRRAAKEVYYANSHGSTDLMLLDALAETLLRNVESENADTLDGVAWLCLTLGRSKNGRYTDVLNTAVQTLSKRNAKRHCKDALRWLPRDDPMPRYVRGSMGLPE